MIKLTPKYGYSLSSITATARHADSFGEEGISELLCQDRMLVIVPEPTANDREQYGLPAGEEWDDGTQAACEYRDAFVPMMNSLWPVDLAYERSEDAAAALMNEHAGATSLVKIDEDYYIAMTGGGMNLSWHLAAAYVCCGCVPPMEILQSLKGSPFRRTPVIHTEIMKAWRKAVKWLRHSAKQLQDDMRATSEQFKKGKEAA